MEAHILTASEGNVFLQSSCSKQCLLARCWSLATPQLLTWLKPCRGLFWGGSIRGWLVGGSASGAVQCEGGQHHVLISIGSRGIFSQMKLLLWNPVCPLEAAFFCGKEVAPVCSVSQAALEALLGGVAEAKVWVGSLWILLFEHFMCTIDLILHLHIWHLVSV